MRYVVVIVVHRILVCLLVKIMLVIVVGGVNGIIHIMMWVFNGV